MIRIQIKGFESISVFFKQKGMNSQGFESPTYGFESITWKLKNTLRDSNPNQSDSNPSVYFQDRKLGIATDSNLLQTDSNPTDGKCFLTASFWRVEGSNGYNTSPTAITDSKGIYTPKILWRTWWHTSREARSTQIKWSNNSKRKLSRTFFLTLRIFELNSFYPFEWLL